MRFSVTIDACTLTFEENYKFTTSGEMEPHLHIIHCITLGIVHVYIHIKLINLYTDHFFDPAGSIIAMQMIWLDHRHFFSNWRDMLSLAESWNSISMF